MTDEDQQIAATAIRAGAPRSIVGSIVRSANVVGRRISGAVVARSPAPVEGEFGPRRRKTLWCPNPYLLSFILAVVIPSLLSIAYLAFAASDQYVVEARFAVQSAQFGLEDGKTRSLSTSAIPVMADQDAYIIADYIRSRTILDDLKGTVDVKSAYQRPEADFWARLKPLPSPEDLTSYWDGMVDTYVDGPSGIVTLTVRAFRPGDAVRLARAVIAASEKLANNVSTRARTMIMKEAEDEVRSSGALVSEALADLRDFRDQQGFIDPASAATSTSKLLMGTLEQKIALENQYFVATREMSPNAPTVIELKTRLDGLDAQIAKLKAELTGNSPQRRTIAASLVSFERLELKRVFAEKLYTLAEDGLERARLRAEQQNIFISTFVPPAMPQDAKYPQRLWLSLLIPTGLAIFWGIFALIGLAIDDHRY